MSPAPLLEEQCPHDQLDHLLHRNKAWATITAIEDPDLFPELVTDQKPKILWIGCSDSRCPETTLLHLKPGDVFVERNIANILHPDDKNSPAVIEYAVKHLEVEMIILCGHKDCGGVEAVYQEKELGPVLGSWLEPLKEVKQAHWRELEGLPEEKALIRLAELNVLRGVEVLKGWGFVEEAMRGGLRIYGLLYDVGTGRLRELVNI
ncbi:carbonic anhydrase [Aspergillus karnatakaensis]|uniref:carbonic anhydrase n=1 Tax=Aspergillus karnatakaensis TaxID=1810916 RepID=UPI003CCE023E